jgi:hypothetical protein
VVVVQCALRVLGFFERLGFKACHAGQIKKTIGVASILGRRLLLAATCCASKIGDGLIGIINARVRNS